MLILVERQSLRHFHWRFQIVNLKAVRKEIFPLVVTPDATSWAQAAADEMRKSADAVAAAPEPLHLREERVLFAQLGKGTHDLIDRLAPQDLIDRDRCLYVFGLDDEADPEAIMRAYREAKERPDPKLKLPQNNFVSSTTSRVLYVGSSCATGKRKHTLRSRLSQHLLCAPAGTYALSLAKWASGLEGGLVVNTWQYPSLGEGPEGDKAARHLVLAIEDWLSNKLAPMLGRRGSRH